MDQTLGSCELGRSDKLLGSFKLRSYRTNHLGVMNWGHLGSVIWDL